MSGSVFPCLLALVILFVSHPVYAQSSTSKHIITFNGTAWDSVVQGNSSGLGAALITDMGVQLNRSYAFNTTITVDSLSTSGNLQVGVTVQQTLLPTVAEPWLEHTWIPREVNSLLEQDNFSTTLAMCPGPDASSLVSVRIPEAEKELTECTGVCKGMIAMGGIIVGLMIILFIVALLYVCCGCGANRASKEFSYYESGRGNF
ncbi:uncharacterized protein TM35_000292040 [Trypanosoma theileri]|uniref:Uncharacterized protein n=1 Tax=Trypanosoma theileri TaxID=67003 RepID=A0A1X0NNM7_9TRYP|nr:uncharacterized protein TM35_000292040 [Trypanosoma theileri]ORC86322.1 hypothetical protein TM35_000292040 [Trypanosoma theileri]